ncbi:MAG TPA: FtsX-like permease family protein [Pyrinomonadaceae bacterium]|jgi:ABC-type lipoprotein release transport system permease subunit|nr:FtsX-like permease family protein [Pyrinomonadaceae bacterium]
MSLLDILNLALRNLRQAKLRSILTTMGVIVGVAVIVTMVSFGLGLQRNMLSRFKALDLFNEVQVFGRTMGSLVAPKTQSGSRNENERRRFKTDVEPTRTLDDAAIAEISKIPGVAYAEPSLTLIAFVRTNAHSQIESIGGASVPNAGSRFKDFVAGQMISSASADEAVVTDTFARDFGYENPADAIGKTLEFLSAKDSDEGTDQQKEEEPPSFFGLPLEEGSSAGEGNDLVVRTFRIVGVLNPQVKEGAGQGGLRGLFPGARIYIPLRAARQWGLEHRGPMSQVALALARQSGKVGESETEGYDSAIIRVDDPVALTAVRNRLKELGFASFSIVDQLEQFRTVFLIIDSVLGLLGGISLLVASFGIANTMIMSILERTREIGIMKAIGAEDREIKLIFFVEAAVLGLVGGFIGVLAAWAIDAIANRLAYRFFLKPNGASFVDFFYLPPWLSIGAILFALFVSILAALYPAARAARIDPVRALRHD